MAEHATYFADDKARRIYMTKKILSRIFCYFFLTIFALFLLAPFVMMVVGSFINYQSFPDFSTSADFEY